MERTDESRPGHQVYHVARPMGHGMMDQKRMKGMRSPMVSQVPHVSAGNVPGAEGAGSPGMPNGMYSGTDQTGS